LAFPRLRGSDRPSSSSAARGRSRLSRRTRRGGGRHRRGHSESSGPNRQAAISVRAPRRPRSSPSSDREERDRAPRDPPSDIRPGSAPTRRSARRRRRSPGRSPETELRPADLGSPSRNPAAKTGRKHQDVDRTRTTQLEPHRERGPTRGSPREVSRTSPARGEQGDEDGTPRRSDTWIARAGRVGRQTFRQRGSGLDGFDAGRGGHRGLCCKRNNGASPQRTSPNPSVVGVTASRIQETVACGGAARREISLGHIVGGRTNPELAARRTGGDTSSGPS